jgi:hypothetical protein
MTTVRFTATARAATVVGVFALVGLLLSGCGGSGRIHGSGAGTATTAVPVTTPPTTAPPAAPTDVVQPLYLGHGLGIVAEDSLVLGGCSQLLATTDFTHWRNISPPQQSGTDDSCPDIWQSASFVSPLEGWVLGRNGTDVSTVLYRTDNGGTTWLEEAGSSVGSNAGTQVIGFTNAEDGWRQQFATGSNAAYLLETTADGGATWTGIPQIATNGGCAFALDVFANPLDGFAGNNLAPGVTSSLGPPPPQAFLWQTTDGGNSWHEATAPAPAGATRATAFYGLPTFLSATSGILPVEYVENGTAGAATLDFYSTADAGTTWTLVSTVKTAATMPADTGPAGCSSSPSSPSSPSSQTGGSFPAVAIAGPTTWWVVSPAALGTTVDVTSNGGGSWTDVPAAGLGSDGTAGAQLTLVGAAGPTIAWASVVNEADESAPASFQTTDGGRTWIPLAPAVPAASATSPPCTNDQLGTSLGKEGAGLGHVGEAIVFTNVSTSACTLHGYPGVAGLDAAGTQIMQAGRTPSGYLGG